MVLFLCLVLCLEDIKLGISIAHLGLNQGCVSHTDVVVSTFWDLLAKILQSLSRCSQLSNLGNFEFLSLLLHLLKEYGQVLWNFIVANQVFDVVSNVEFLAEVLAHRVYGLYRIWELNIRLIGIIEANRSQYLKLFLNALLILIFLLLAQFNALAVLSVGYSVKVLCLLMESSKMKSIMSDASYSLHQGYSDLNTDGVRTSNVTNGCFVDCQIIVNRLLA